MDNFDEYLIQGEPNKSEKAKVWKTAIGLQEVDGLKPSEYLIATAKLNIEGDISIDEVKSPYKHSYANCTESLLYHSVFQVEDNTYPSGF